MSLRDQIKAVAESALVRFVGTRRREPNGSLILAYHNVVPDRDGGHGDASLHMPWTQFLRHLDILQSDGRVLPLAEVLKAPSTTGGPGVAITIDDAYQGAIELAIPEIERRHLPCTVFVAPGLLGSRSFWWDEYAKPGAGLHPRLRDAALRTHAGHAARVRAGLPAPAASPSLPASYRCADERLIGDLASSRCVTIGAHSWNHPNLAALAPEELALELSMPRDWVRQHFRNHVDVLAYPYGLSSHAVEQATAAAGYGAGLLVEGGWMEPTTANRWALPRLNVPASLSANGLRLRLAGVLGA